MVGVLYLNAMSGCMGVTSRRDVGICEIRCVFKLFYLGYFLISSHVI